MKRVTCEVNEEQAVQVPAGSITLEGDLVIPANPRGVVVFAHGSGSGRHSPRNRLVARQLRAVGFATLLLDLCTEKEAARDQDTAPARFNIRLLADRLLGAAAWLAEDPRTTGLAVGYFGASTGAAAALVAAARQPSRVEAVVSRGGRPDLAKHALKAVVAPTLFIVGAADVPVIAVNKAALVRLAAPLKKLEVVRGASHLFAEPGKLEEAARLAADWFNRYVARGP